MEFKELLNNRLIKAGALLGLSLLSFTTTQAQTNVTVDASAAWQGGMLCFENNQTQDYLWYNDWGIDDIKTVRNTANNTLELYPNYNTYVATDAYWANGAEGNKILQGMSLVVDDALVGQQFTFSGTVVSNNLTSAYTVYAFVKALDANWGVLNETPFPLNEPGNFTINYNAAQYAGAAHIQYGFSVRGINANPAAMEANGKMVITAGEPQTTNPGGGDATIVPVNAGAAWAGGMLCYENNQTQDYLWYNDWGIDDIKTVRNTTDNTVILYPNYNTYSATDAYWANGDQGNKILQGISYVLDDSLLSENISFKGNVTSYTISSAYTVYAFVKSLDANYGLIHETVVPITSAGEFAVNFDSDNYPGSVHLQYGFSVRGINANPAFMEQNGNVVIGQAAAGVAPVVKKAIAVYPNPATNVLNINAEDIISNVQVYNMLGQQVININPNSTTATLNVSEFKAGIYMVNTTSNGKTTTTRFIKQ